MFLWHNRDKKIYFEQYIPAFNQVAQQLGIEGVNVKLASEVVANIIADEHEQWDGIVLVEHPSAEAFNTIAQSDIDHQIATSLREAGIAKLKLFMTRQLTFKSYTADMSELILSNFALHIALAPDEQEQVLALLQLKAVTKRSILLRPGEIERHIRSNLSKTAVQRYRQFRRHYPGLE